MFIALVMLLASACVAAVWSPVTAPGAYDFGTLDAGAGATKTVTFTLSNTDKRATAAMSVGLQGSNAFQITQDKCSGKSLPPRKTCQVTVRYAPAASGQTDDATLAATGPHIDTTIALSGKSGTPDLAWSPTSYDFGTVDAAAAPPTQTFTLTNSGTGSSDVLSAAVTGAAAMTLSDDTCTGIALAPAASCTLTVGYAPTGSGQDDSATLSAGGAAAALSGKSGTPNLGWSPATYDFGTVDAAATPPTQSFTLTNSGTGSSAVLAAAVTGSDAMTLSDDTCTGTTLAPGGTCSVTVTYAPTANGQSDSATLAAGGADATLSGKSGTPDLAWSPASYDFGTVDAAAAPRTQSFTLTNSGTGTSDSLTASLTGSDAMTTSDDTCTGTTLAPGGSCAVTVTYAPASSGQDDSGTLSAGGTDATITGKSGTPDLAWSPNTYDFGTVDAGDTPTQDFTLTNSGDGSSDTLTAAVTGSDAMTLSADTCTGAALAPGGACTVTVEYAPTGTSTDSATLSAGGASADVSGAGEAAAPLQITGIDVDDDPGLALILNAPAGSCGPGVTNCIEGSQDNIFTAELANVPAAGVTYQWTITTPAVVGYVVAPDQTESSLLIRADGIPDFAPKTITMALTVTPKDGGSPVTATARILYRNSALTLSMDDTCHGIDIHTFGPGVTPVASATSIPLDGSLTITQTIVPHLGPGCDIGLPFEGTVTISSDGQILDTFSGGPDVGNGTSPSPVGPFVIPASTLGVGGHTITVSYAIWNGPAWAPFSFDFPVTVTSP